MSRRPAKQRLRVVRRPAAATGPPPLAEGFYWYLPQPGDPLYDPQAPGHGAAVVHVTPTATEDMDAWFPGNPSFYTIGTDGYQPDQFVGPLAPPTRGEHVDGYPST
jgi:hypothetical protein